MNRYTATVDGNLIDTKNDITLHIKEAKVIPARRKGEQEKLAIVLESGAKAVIARWNVDETAHSFGSAPVKATKATRQPRSTSPPPPGQPSPAAPPDGVYLTRKEVLDLYTAGKALVELTLPKLLPE